MADSSHGANGAGAAETRTAGLTDRNWKRLGLAVLLLALCLLPFGLEGFPIHMLTKVMIYAVAILGLNILTGYNGQFSLGHGAFVALGGYASAIMMFHWGVPYYLAVPLAGAVCLIFGFLFGFPALRLEGLYLALATFALAVSMPQILKYHLFEAWTGGVQGIDLVGEFDRSAPLGLPLDEDQWLYFFTLAVTLVMFVVGWNLLRGRSGRAMVAIRDHRIAAESMGINLTIYKTWTFGVSAMYAGVAGALLTILVEFVAPESFDFFLSISLLVGLVIGGLASISGAIYGAIFVQYAQTIASDLASNIALALSWGIWGVFLLVFMYVMPTGFVGLIRDFRLNYRRLWRGGVPLARTFWYYGVFVYGMLALVSVTMLTILGIDTISVPSIVAAVVVGAGYVAYSVLVFGAIWRSAGGYEGRIAWGWPARAAAVVFAVAWNLSIARVVLG